MTHNKYKQRLKSYGKPILLLPLLMALCLSSFAQAVTGGPGQPEFSSFEPSYGREMVNPTTGDFTYNIPLLSVPGPNGSFPLSLFYHGGIRTEQVASWTGLGWGMNAGSINRSVVGNPDDWKDKKRYVMTYDYFETIGKHKLQISSPVPEVPLSLSFDWGTHQSLGVGISATLPLQNLGIPADFPIQKLPFSLNLQKGNSSLSLLGLKFSGSQGASSSADLSQVMSEVIDQTSWNLYFAKYNYTLTKYWASLNEFKNFYGALYLPEVYNTDPAISVADYYSNPYEKYETSDVGNNSLTMPGYDTFSMLSEGLMGGFNLNYWQDASIPKNTDHNRPEGFVENENPDPLNLGLEQLNFSFNNLKLSTPKLPSGSWSVPASTPNTYDDPANSVSKTGNTPILPSNDYYNVANNHAGTPNYIRWFSNRELYDNYYPSSNPSSSSARDAGFMEYDEYYNSSNTFTEARINPTTVNPITLNPTTDSLFDADGIGAVLVTTPQGVTYHFALPVYQFEIFKGHQGEFNGSPSEKDYFAEFQRDMYATNWLLTGITGADFVDKNNDGKINEGDLGYWVKFSYGKWSDGYMWRNPYDGFGTQNGTGDQGTFQIGRKQVYYLNTIETASHIAYFIKDVRKDALGANFTQPISSGVGEFFRTESKQVKDIQSCEGLDEYKHSMVLSYMFPNFEPHKLLYLSEIILARKEDAVALNISKNHTPNHFPSVENINRFLQNEFYEFWDSQFPVGVDDSHWKRCSEFVNQKKYFSTHLSENVIDVSDVPSNLPSDKVLSRIKFNYDYSLAEQTPNSISTTNDDNGNQGRLSLNSVEVRNPDNSQTTPSLKFDYYDLSNYNHSARDDWGYHASPGINTEDYKDFDPKTNAHNWSLKSITTPSGGEMEVVYESDTYAREAVFGGTKHLVNLNDLPIHGIGLSCMCNPGPNGNAKVPVYVDLPANLQGYISTYNLQHGTLTVTTTNSNNPSTNYPADVQLSPVTYDPQTHQLHFETWCLSGTTSNCVSITGVVTIQVELENFDANGGGIRVKEIISKASEGQVGVKTTYSYDDPNTGRSSGVTSYAPRDDQRFIPYVFEIPGPRVMYEYVTTEQISENGESLGKSISQFEVLKSATTSTDDKEFALGDQFWVDDTQAGVDSDYAYNANPYNLNVYSQPNNAKYSDHLNLRTATVHDKTSRLGRPLEVSVISPQGVTLSNTSYSYANGIQDNDGQYQETFHNVHNYSKPEANPCYNVAGIQVPCFERNWYFTTSSKIRYPNIISSIRKKGLGAPTITEFSGRKLYTGEVQSTKIYRADGDILQTGNRKQHEIVGNEALKPKVIDINNKNMLHIPALSVSAIKQNGGNIKVVDASTVQVWKNDWYFLQKDGSLHASAQTADIWLPWKTYSWKGFINEDGSYDNGGTYQPFDPANPTANGWVLTSEAKTYDWNMNMVEAADINGRKSSSIFGYDPYHRVLAAAMNSNRFEFTFSGAEDWDTNLNKFGARVGKGDATLYEYTGDLYDLNNDWNTNNQAHTGRFALDLSAVDTKGFNYNSDVYNPIASPDATGFRNDAMYRVSVWVRNATGSGLVNNVEVYAQQSGAATQVKVTDGNDFQTADGWQLLNFDIDMSQFQANQTVEIGIRHTGIGANVFADDFRVHRVDDPITSIVYDPVTGEVIAKLDYENIASLTRNEEEKREIWTYKETKKGIKKVAKRDYNFSRKD